jgi:hypothetical protein
LLNPLRSPCSPFGSHVLEALLLQLQPALRSCQSSEAVEVVGELAYLVKEDLLDYITNKYGTFFARRLLQLLTNNLNEDVAASPSSQSGRTGIANKLKIMEVKSGKSVITSALRQGKDKEPENSVDADCAAAMLRHVQTFSSVLSGPAFDQSTIVALQRSERASPFLQALVKAVCDGYASVSQALVHAMRPYHTLTFSGRDILLLLLLLPLGDLPSWRLPWFHDSHVNCLNWRARGSHKVMYAAKKRNGCSSQCLALAQKGQKLIYVRGLTLMPQQLLPR